MMIKTLTILLNLVLALNANAQIIFVIEADDKKEVKGVIIDESKSVRVATFSLESNRAGVLYKAMNAHGALRVAAAYAAGQINEYTLTIEITDANYKLESVLWGSSDLGNFSRGGGTVIGISLDQKAKFVHTNAHYSAVKWSDNGGISSMLATELNGATLAADSLLQTDSYIKMIGERGNWGLLTGGSTVQKFTYGEVGGIIKAALDSFEISVNFIQAKVSEP